MNNPLQKPPETPDLKREIPFWSSPNAETSDGVNVCVENPDTLLSMIVLLLACLALAVLANAFV